ncbi:hypothetical protein [Victivallis lenta]|uniref:hypothetical protein n=1 Tax=Victivallis lenta TaxID=2606640 RepID=UPI003AF28642
MKQIDFTVIGEKILFKYNGAAVMVDFSKFDPADKPVSGVMMASGIAVVVKGV